MRLISLLIAIVATVPATGAVTRLYCDVVVVGGGSAGFAAAWSAAKRGADVVLVEREDSLGGTSTVGGVCSWEPVCGARGLPELVYERLKKDGSAGVYRFAHHCSWPEKGGSPQFPGALLEIDRGMPYSATLRRHGPGIRDEKWFRANCRGVIFDPDAMSRTMREMLGETGRCRVMTGVSFVAAEHDGGRVTTLRLSDGTVIEPKIVVDACGAVAKATGCELMNSDRPNGASLIYRVERSDGAAAQSEPPPRCWWAEKYPSAFCMVLPNGEVVVNMLPTISGEEVRRLGEAAAQEEARRRVEAHWRWMQTRWPAFAGWRICRVAKRLAHRETFRVRGDYVLAGGDVRDGVRPFDEIASADHALDAHGGAGFGGELKAPYGIPYRCLIAAGMDNLLLAGRIASFDPAAASSCRLSRTMMKLGEAAGSAAAAASLGGKTVRQVDLAEIRDVFVSPNGDDAAIGDRLHPVATPARALALAEGRHGAAIRLAGGIYELDAPLALSWHHDGVSLVAEVGTEAVLSGGRRVRVWRRTDVGWWSTKVDPTWRFSQLYVNDRRRLRPYRPRSGYYQVGRKVGVPPGVKPTQFVCREGDIVDGMSNFRRIEFCSFQNWVMSRVPLKDFDPATRLVTLAGGVSRPGQCELTDEHWYRLDNVRDALGEVAGEWYLEEDGTLLYVPATGEDMSTAEVVAPRLDRLVVVDGVRDVTFRGVTFAHSGWNVPAAGHAACQAESRLAPWAVLVSRCSGVRFDRCTFRHTGAGALEFGKGSRNCVAADCEFFDLGGGGVHVGPEWEGKNPGDNSTDFAFTPPADYVYGCEVTNSLVASGGRVQAGAVGIWVSHAPDTRIVGNTIRDFYYSGMSVGWHWALGTNSTWGCVIDGNEISQIGQGVLSDLGGIYTTGAQRGTVMRNNYIHDVTRAHYGAWGIYFDSGSSFIVATNNFVANCQDGGWMLARLSASNRVERNTFAGGGKYQIYPLERRRESSPTVFAGNRVVWKEGKLMPHVPSAKSVEFRGNSVWCGKGVCGALPPGFERVAEPPLPLFDARHVGCSLDPVTGKLPQPLSVFQPKPLPAETGDVEEDFESLASGGEWPGWVCYPASTALVHVAEGVACGGRHSLCVKDDERPGYRPFLEAHPYMTSGRLKVSFDLLVEKGARPRFEMRDAEVGELMRGPCLMVDEEGRFRAGAGAGSVVADVPYGEWVHVEMSCALAGMGNGYDLRLSWPGAESPVAKSGLGMHPGFSTLGWMAFIAESSGGERFYVDNFKLSPLSNAKAGENKKERKR